LGVAFGAVLQLLIVGLGMIGMDFHYRPKINFRDKGFRQVLRILPARSVDQGIDYIESIAEIRFASELSVGSVTNYENAVMLYNAPVALIGTAISTAAFPRLTDRIAQGRPDLFRKEFLRVLKTMIWIAMPIAVLSFFIRDYLARLIFARNNREIAIIFGFLCVAIFFRILYSIISRYYYAHKDTKTPLYVSLFVIALNIFLAYSLSKPHVFGVAGLAIAQSIVAFTEVSILVTIMIMRDRALFDSDFMQSVGKTLAVTCFSALTGFLCVKILPLGLINHSFVIIVKLSVISLFVLSVHLIVSFAFGLNEAKTVVDRLKRVILRPVRL
jgi:putative peptidoglycan lipid II flippase